MANHTDHWADGDRWLWALCHMGSWCDKNHIALCKPSSEVLAVQLMPYYYSEGSN